MALQQTIGIKIEMEIEIEKSLLRQGYLSPVLIGRGAHSFVCRVQEAATGKLYACKIGREGSLWRQEAILLKRLTHPLFPCYGRSFLENGQYFLIMEYVSGETLEQILKRRGHLTQKQAVKIALSLAEGLAYLEGLPDEILFRDLKPQNIKIREDGQVKLLDLGCACPASQAGHSMAGTIGYAAPEQLGTFGEIGAYSDVYAFGRLLHFMLTGDDPCLPPKKKPPIRAYDRGLDGRLECLVEECVGEEIRTRLPDMRCVLRKLQDFASKKDSPFGKSSIFSKKSRLEFIYEKNVFKAGNSP